MSAPQFVLQDACCHESYMGELPLVSSRSSMLPASFRSLHIQTAACGVISPSRRFSSVMASLMPMHVLVQAPEFTPMSGALRDCLPRLHSQYSGL